MQPWYTYDIVVPFGDKNFDVALGGAHDTDLGCPPNHPITALLSGVVSSVTSPRWGLQVGVKLDKAYKGVPYCAYLHLSAVNPQLTEGNRVNVGDLIGWTGGGTNDAMYQNTTNPTGHNFLNDTFNSSRIQAGFALMRGPVYGGVGWQTFPPVDWSLDPTQIILDARNQYTPTPPQPDYSEAQFRAIWTNSPCQPTLDTGIYKALLSYHKTLHIGMPVSKEFATIDWSNTPIIYQDFASNYHVEHSPTTHKTSIINEKNVCVATL